MMTGRALKGLLGLLMAGSAVSKIIQQGSYEAVGEMETNGMVLVPCRAALGRQRRGAVKLNLSHGIGFFTMRRPGPTLRT